MKKLPTEIVVEIASYLSMSDKINLVCACKQLHKTLSESTLYNKLVVEDKLKFGQAMEQYKKKNFGQQVRDLCIGNIDYDYQLVTAIPTLFPKLRSVELKRGDDKLGSQISELGTNVFSVVAGNWKNV